MNTTTSYCTCTNEPHLKPMAPRYSSSTDCTVSLLLSYLTKSSLFHSVGRVHLVQSPRTQYRSAPNHFMANFTLAFTAIQRWSSLRPQCNLYFNEASSIPTVTIGTAVNNLYCIPQLPLTFPSAAGLDSIKPLTLVLPWINHRVTPAPLPMQSPLSIQTQLLDSVVFSSRIAYCSS